MSISKLSCSRSVRRQVNTACKHLRSEHSNFTTQALSEETIRTFGLRLSQRGPFSGRIVIPIQNEEGTLIAYAGRSRSDTNKSKYIFSDEFNKSRTLFNLHRAIQVSNPVPLVIVQGLFDVIELWQHGLQKVVALMGSHFSNGQEKLIHEHIRLNTRIIIMLNEDDAGNEARETIAYRLAPFYFVKIFVFDCPGSQPKDLTPEQLGTILAL